MSIVLVLTIHNYYTFNSADVVVVPSLADNLPNVAMSSCLCKTIIWFPSSGLDDVIIDGFNGRLATCVSASSLFNLIHESISNTTLLSYYARNSLDLINRKFSTSAESHPIISLSIQFINK